MIISIALGIVLAVVILRLMPVMLELIVIACRIAGALLKLSVQMVRYMVLSIFLGIMRRIRAARLGGSLTFGLFLGAVIIAFFALTR